MKYKELLDILLQATTCELQQNVTVYSKELDEFHPVTSARVCGEQADGVRDNAGDGVLDDGHLYLEIEG